MRKLVIALGVAGLLGCVDTLGDAIVGNSDGTDTVVVHDTTVTVDTVYCHHHFCGWHK